MRSSLVLPKQELDKFIQLQQIYQNQIQELEAKVAHLEAENYSLKAINQELQWRVDPYSSEGNAICNSDW
ncbi:hypothetical protein IQ264_18150 [Phormidium sp. LEGE 05292]|uniref:hypothetical protein n=1 Tax=[Phormidium] sp. LEGE 05292 TaxID=767427 RepID=UPI001881A7F8|nr:hypothetical protein [Phormidium sp. LEGE 05292]MBE9227353.1 hypothetical protein [Phormidium sp. LEGE 05292]